MSNDINTDDLRDFYAGKQFEFGWTSLCRMILPEDLEGKTVLDIGCRRGKGVFKLSDRVGAQGMAIGVDWAEPYVREAQEKSERAWRDTGLPRSNMRFAVGYPENLSVAGVEDGSVDLVYVNSVVNLAYDVRAALAEIARVLKPGGLLVLEGVTANVARDEAVVAAAREIGNSIQAAPEKTAFLDWIAAAGLVVEEVTQEASVFVDTGYKAGYKADAIESDEAVTFTAAVFHARKSA